ncbi:MFS transporter [Pseudoxanthomonas sp. UTMC 1351]|uniref:MFS transporter n=1 Tax=Pseudoxanthomonas sp. UTMC 1351 TaxID=2695853 RepID=UPI0034CD4F19
MEEHRSTPHFSGHKAGTAPGAREQFSTRIAFLIAGLAVSAWAPLIPYARQRLHVDDAQLGLLLLCLGIGSVAGMPLAGGLAARFGCRRVLLCMGAMFCIALPFLAIAPTMLGMALALLIFGAGIGIFDVVMNIQAVIVERSAHRAMMSGFHGMYSVGGIAGAGGASALMALGSSPLVAAVVVALLAAVALAAIAKALLPYAAESGAPAFVLPRGSVLLIGAICFALFLAEGAVLDWSAVFLTAVRNVDPATAGFGYVAFAATMTLGRLTGDCVVHRLGATRVVLFGALLAASGFLLAILAPSWVLSIIGFGLVGAGASNVVPVMFSAAGRQQVMPTHLAVAAITTMGYAGVLLGPALLGFVAKATTLSFALGLLAALLVAVAMTARAVTR